ncbi:MAG: hypothetical protein FWC79_00720 [Oscillospiraceae bacterium]|nr:hypothetical protein [Oscillospiraceae bacterium]
MTRKIKVVFLIIMLLVGTVMLVGCGRDEEPLRNEDEENDTIVEITDGTLFVGSEIIIEINFRNGEMESMLAILQGYDEEEAREMIERLNEQYDTRSIRQNGSRVIIDMNAEEARIFGGLGNAITREEVLEELRGHPWTMYREIGTGSDDAIVLSEPLLLEITFQNGIIAEIIYTEVIFDIDYIREIYEMIKEEAPIGTVVELDGDRITVTMSVQNFNELIGEDEGIVFREDARSSEVIELLESIGFAVLR